MNHYECLCLSPEATDADIKKRYYLLAKFYHPDLHRTPDTLAYAGDRMRAINLAYEVLGDRVERTRYDRTIGAAQHQTGEVDPAALHFQFAQELYQMEVVNENLAMHTVCTHLEACLSLATNAEMILAAKMSLIDLFVMRAASFQPPQKAFDSAQRLCREVWEGYPGSEVAQEARLYHLRAASGLGMQEFKQSLDELVANAGNMQTKVAAYAIAASFYRFTARQFSMAIAFYEMAYNNAADHQIKANACYEMARCYDSDMSQHLLAKQWYARCVAEFPGTREANDCGWRIQWLSNKT